MSYFPVPEKLAPLGFGMPTQSYGKQASTTYFNIEQTKAIVLWPGSREVRLAVKPLGHSSWSDLYTGILSDEQTFNRLLVIEAFIFPEQLRNPAPCPPPPSM